MRVYSNGPWSFHVIYLTVHVFQLGGPTTNQCAAQKFKKTFAVLAY